MPVNHFTPTSPCRPHGAAEKNKKTFPKTVKQITDKGARKLLRGVHELGSKELERPAGRSDCTTPASLTINRA